MADDRTYIRVHDGMDEHPKIEGLSDAAFRALHRCLYYCSRQLTDGRLNDVAWKNRAKTPKVRRELVDAGLVHPPGHECDHEDCAQPEAGFVQMHDYLDWQRSAAEVAELKAAKGAGGQLGNHIKWHVKRRQPNPDCEFCIANGSQDRSDNRSEDRSQNDRSPIANGSHSHKQRQIQSSSVETSGGNATEVDAWRDPNEPPKCFNHRGMRRDCTPDCKPCEHKRKQWEAAVKVQAEFGGDPWCGDDTCHPITRRRETRFGSILCPQCHPLAGEETA